MLKTLPAFGAVIVAALLVVPTVGQAATTNSVRVSYSDLNLASDVGLATLEGRIAGAARQVCEIEDSRDLVLANATQSCRAAAVASAQPALDAAVAAVRKGTVTVLDGAALIISAQ